MPTVFERRKCHICGFGLTFFNFVATSHFSRIYEIIGSEMVKIIWENDIFVLYCCSCYRKKGLHQRHTCPRCGSGVIKSNMLCFDCWADESRRKRQLQ